MGPLMNLLVRLTLLQLKMELPHMTRTQTLIVALVACLFPVIGNAELKTPAIFGDGMVLQRGMEIPVWGWAEPGTKVSVHFREQASEATTDENGKWKAVLKSEQVGEPGTLSVKAADEVLTFKDVLVGEVWVCSGQSNMAMTVNRSIDGDLEALSADYPEIRLFKVPLKVATSPQSDVAAQWVPCTPETAPTTTAVGFYFCRQLHHALGVPVGLVQTAWGGTRAEAWTSPDAMAKTEELKPILDTWDGQVKAYDAEKDEAKYQAALKRWDAARIKAKEQGRNAPRKPQKLGPPDASRHYPSNLYNAMIAPLTPYAIRGAIWYQGEGNANRAYQYRTLMPTMIQSWRDAWGQGDFPFYQVQLANFRPVVNEPAPSSWAELREAQIMATQTLPNVGAVCITDIGAALDIHPKDKQNVGKRLARYALHHDYGMKNLVPSGPTYESWEVKDGKTLVHFHNHGAPLMAWYRKPVTGFQVAGEDKKWVWANAKIVNPTTVLLSHESVSKPVAIRYNWADNPQGTLYNNANLPASPFRTDDWRGMTFESVTP